MLSHFNTIIIGGGASGMMAAGRAASRGLKVLLLEKNAVLGKKLSITGGGRCNITNAQYDNRILLSQFGNAAPFLFSTFAQFGVRETFAFFESLGLPLKIEANNRAFPQTERAMDVVTTLENHMRAAKVEVMTNVTVQSIEGSGSQITGVVTNQGTFTADSYILATGSNSHPETGSTGDGFSWLANLGHTVQPPTATLVPLTVQESWVKELSGTSINDMKITFFVDAKNNFSLKGRILFTHFGISGPLIINAARRVSDLLHEGEVTASIDLFPTLNHGELDKHLIQLFDTNKNKVWKNIAKEIMPPGLAKTLLNMPFIDAETPVHSITKSQRSAVMHYLKAMPLTVTGLLSEEHSIVVDGGLALTEIDMKTMRSKKISNLFVTGDLLHINRPSGGYSLQLCWTTGWVAGNHVGNDQLPIINVQ